MNLSIATWKYDRDWVYSITYDEALADLARFVIPVHEELGVPGHVEVVANQIGQPHACGASSFNGMRNMNADELRALMAAGWGVGCHSWSHEMVKDNLDLELRQARETIEEAIGAAVTVYCAPGSNENLTPEILARLPEYGYLAGMSITDDINHPDAAVWINRVPIHERYWGVFDSAFDPYKRIRQAQVEHGWIVDYCHCPLPEPMHPYKDCTAAHHRERLEAVVAEGGGSCWFANPDAVVDYRYMRRHTRVEQAGDGRFAVQIESLPERVRSRELSFLLTEAGTPEVLSVSVDGASVPCAPTRAGALCFTAPIDNGTSIAVERRSPR